MYVDLTASQVRIDSLLPVFSWQKPLGVNYADSVYRVSIEYPEFIDMQEVDIQRYLQISGGKPLPEMPVVNQTVGVARKQGVLDVSFVPLVYRHGKYQKLGNLGPSVRGLMAQLLLVSGFLRKSSWICKPFIFILISMVRQFKKVVQAICCIAWTKLSHISHSFLR